MSSLEKSETDSKKIEYVDIDGILDHIGQIGKLQIILLVIFSCLLLFPSYQAVSSVFIDDSPSWSCNLQNNVTNVECNSSRVFKIGEYGYESRCSMKRESWKYTTTNDYSIATEFDLVCSRSPLLYLSGSAIFIGKIIGGITMGWLSDKYGRKKWLFICFFSECLLAFLQSFSTNIWWYMAFRIMVGIFHSGVFLIALIMAIEVVGQKYRSITGILIYQTWTLALFLLTVQGYFIRQWRKLSIVVSIPYMFLMFSWLIIPESARWLRSKNKIEETEKFLRRIAKSNKKVYPPNVKIAPIKYNDEDTGSFKELFLPFSALLVILKFSVMEFANEFTYYGMTFSASEFTGDLYVDSILLTLVEIPSNISMWLLEKIGRKKTALLGYVGAALPSLIFSGMQANGYKNYGLQICLGMTAKIFSLIAWAATLIWYTEYFPTNLRGKAAGVLVIASQLGGACSPWVSDWVKEFYVALPFFIMGGLQFFAGICALTLRETRGDHISDVKEDEKNLHAAKNLLEKDQEDKTIGTAEV